MASGPERARAVALEVVGALRDAGHVAYFAGGCVRDEMLGLHPKDFDVATDATPERVHELFPRAREVGRAFGVMLVHKRGITVEVTTFRREGVYSDRRRPDDVEFTDARTDAARRDFTINALFIDPLDTSESPIGRVIDYVGGRSDLERRVIRAVGDPDARLSEDNLRALRAVRFASRLGFEIEQATGEAITRHARELDGVSRERVGEEVRMMLRAPTRSEAIALLESLGLDGPVLEEAGGARADLSLVDGLDADARFAGALAAWAIGRAQSQSAASIDSGAKEVVLRWRRALCLSNDERDEMLATLRGVALLETGWADAGVARRKRWASGAWFGVALSLVARRDPALEGAIRADVETLAATEGGLAPTPLITGDDLVASGYRPGPAFAGWLDRAYDAQLEGRVSTRDQALELVAGLVSGTDDASPR